MSLCQHCMPRIMHTPIKAGISTYAMTTYCQTLRVLAKPMTSVWDFQ